MCEKMKSITKRCLMLLLALVLCCGATDVSVFAAVPNELYHLSNTGTKLNVLHEMMRAIATEPVKVNFKEVSITGRGPVGVELVKTRSETVAFELLHMDNEKNCTAKAEIVNGILRISITHEAPDGINVNFGPQYKNVVRVYIPDAAYHQFTIKVRDMVVQMQDFNAPVHVEAIRAGFWLIDNTVSQGTYNINVSSGPIYIEADQILRDITANADSGPLTICFHQEPTNLYLDSTKCGPVINRPENWPSIYKIGNGTPKIVLSNTGRATIKIKNHDVLDTIS